MKEQEAIELLKGMQNPLQDYANMVGAPAWASGYQYVYQDPEDYAIEEAVIALKEKQNRKWIPVETRMPEREEWIILDEKKGQYLRRLEIAVRSDTIEYFFVYFDGFKWFDKFGRTYTNIIAWKIHEPFNSGVSDAEKMKII